MTDEVGNSARQSIAGILFQFIKSLEYCFDLKRDQSLFIEKFGDIAITDDAQIEVKHYSDALTDSHKNVWNTLQNWLRNEFDPGKYTNLMLLTTQEIGKTCKFKDWNSKSAEFKLVDLESILSETDARLLVRQKDKTDILPSEAHSLMRKILHVDNREKLKSILPKFKILSSEPMLTSEYEELVDKKAKGILDKNKRIFINSLLGFVSSPPVAMRGDGWEISFDFFDKQVQELYSRYCTETRIFPRLPNNPPSIQSEGRLFVKKIEDIQYHEQIPAAIGDYSKAQSVIIEELSSGAIVENYQIYQEEVRNAFAPKHRIAVRNKVGDRISAPQNLYDEVTSAESPEFSGYQRPPRSFRNGVLHGLMDDPQDDLRWETT